MDNFLTGKIPVPSLFGESIRHTERFGELLTVANYTDRMKNIVLSVG
jgi:hypothetical protein